MAHIPNIPLNDRELRVEVRIAIEGHNSIKFFSGEIVSISSQGALLHLNSSSLKTGDRIKFYLVPTDSIFKEKKIPTKFEAIVVQTNQPVSIFRKNHDKDPYYAILFDEPQDFILEHIYLWNQIEIKTAA